MAAAIPAIAGYAVAGHLAALGAYAWASAAIGGIVSFGLMKIMGLDEIPGRADPGIEGTVKGSVQPIPVIYGRRRVGGALAQMMTTSRANNTMTVGDETYNVKSQIDNAIMNMIVVWGEGEVESIIVYLNDRAASHTLYAGYATVESHMGTTDQTASAGFLAALAKTYVPTSAEKFWTTDHRLRGVAYSYIKLTYDRDVFAGGIPTVSALVQGRKVFDVRDQQTRWSDNPALIIYDYLTNNLFGMGIDTAEIDIESFQQAATYCDQQILIPGVNVTQSRYACNVALNTDSPLMDNLRVLLASCRGALVFSGGKYRLKIDKPDVPVFELTEDNIVGGWNIVLESADSRYNKVQAQISNKFLDYEDDFVFVSSPEYLETDGRDLDVQIDLPSVTDPYQAQQIAGLVLRQSRYSLECEVVCTIAGLKCEVFDVVTVTHELPGWDGQLFRVMGIGIENDDQVRLTLRQYADAVYDLDSLNTADSPPPTNLPAPEQMLPVSIGVPDFYFATYHIVQPDYKPVWDVYITIRGNNAFAAAYHVQHSKDPALYGWEQVVIPVDPSQGEQFNYTIKSVPNSRYVYIRARAVSAAGSVSDWVSITATGGRLPLYAFWPTIDTAVPGIRIIGHPNGCLIRWNRPANQPWVRTEIRRAGFLSGITDPASATKVVVTDGESYLDPVPITTSAATVYLYWLQFVDTFGQEGGFIPPYTGRSGLRTYADDATAGADGLQAGDLYKLSTGEVIAKL